MRRAFAVLLVSGVISAGLAVAAPAQALPQCPSGYMCNMVFYQDAARTIRVGGYTYFCSGEYAEWGVRSNYQWYSTSHCPS